MAGFPRCGRSSRRVEWARRSYGFGAICGLPITRRYRPHWMRAWCLFPCTSTRHPKKSRGSPDRPPTRGCIVHSRPSTPNCVDWVRGWSCVAATASASFRIWSNRRRPRRCSGTGCTSRNASSATPASSRRLLHAASSLKVSTPRSSPSPGRWLPVQVIRIAYSRRSGAMPSHGWPRSRRCRRH